MTTSLVNQWIRLEIEIAAEKRDLLAELLWQQESVGFREYERKETLLVEAFFAPVERISPFLSNLMAELYSAGIKPAKCSASLYDFEPDGWLDSYRSSFQAFSVGDTYFVYPPWSKPSPQHPVNIMIEPALAFGTGTHESTQLVLLALEPILPAVESMLDVGTGSGILSIAARKLESSLSVTSLDNDMLAVKSASENLKRNKIAGVQLFVGETRALKSAYDLVVANLTLEIFNQLAGELIRLSRKHLVLSGFTTEQSESVLQCFSRFSSIETAHVWSENDWVCLHLKHETCDG